MAKVINHSVDGSWTLQQQQGAIAQREREEHARLSVYRRAQPVLNDVRLEVKANTVRLGSLRLAAVAAGANPADSGPPGATFVFETTVFVSGSEQRVAVFRIGADPD
jgi:hypothetical protein